jgi:quercetin dioxygenase-like cupin family protein
MVWRRAFLAVMLSLLFAADVAGQSGGETGSDKPANKPAREASIQLVEENEYFRVSRADLLPGAVNKVEQHGRDTIILALGEGMTLVTRKSTSPENLKEGDARFLQQGSVPKIANVGSSLPQLLIVELKRHWDVEVRACSEPSTCTRLIKMGDASIGETTSLFSNGFITAQRHRLDPGGTLDSSYFSSRGKDHLLLIALTDLQANFGGTAETLLRGQTYSSDATEIEVNAPKSEARWIVIRLQTPKT